MKHKVTMKHVSLSGDIKTGEGDGDGDFGMTAECRCYNRKSFLVY